MLGGLNPAQRVPTLVLDDGRSLAESGAILWFFGEGTRFVPTDAYARAQVLQWMFFEQYDHEPAIAVARFWLGYSGRPRSSSRAAPSGRRPATAHSTRWSGISPGATWLVGDTMTLADIALYAYTHVAGEGGFELERYPAIRRWLDRVSSQPGHVTIDA